MKVSWNFWAGPVTVPEWFKERITEELTEGEFIKRMGQLIMFRYEVPLSRKKNPKMETRAIDVRTYVSKDDQGDELQIVFVDNKRFTQR